MSTEINGIDYGPLFGLVGQWSGDKGMDIAPDPDMPKEENPYFETITFEAIGDVTNANRQNLAVLYYLQMVSRKSDQKVFHHQTGYWTWDKATGEVTHSLTIPRAMCVLAGGKATVSGSATTIEVQAALKGKDGGDADWGVIQQPFLRDNASTKAFRMSLTVDGDSLKYREITTLDIYGKTFAHSDENELKRV
jgi:hypothetical protein